MYEYVMHCGGENGTTNPVKLSDMRRYAAAIGRDDIARELERLATTGDRYSLEHFDVMSRAQGALGNPKLWLSENVPALGRGNDWEDTRARCS